MKIKKKSTTYADIIGKVQEDINKQTFAIRTRLLRQIEPLAAQRDFITEEGLKAIIQRTCADFRKAKSIIHLALNPRAQVPIGTTEASNFDATIASYRGEAADRQMAMAINQSEVTDRPEPLTWFEWLIPKASLLLLLGEGIYEAMPFTLMVGAGLLAYPVSLTFAVGKYIFLHWAGGKIHRIEEPKLKFLFIGAILLAASPVFFGLGWARNLYLEKVGFEVPNGVLIFALTSLALFILAWVAEYVYYQHKEDIDTKKSLHHRYEQHLDKEHVVSSLRRRASDLEIQKARNLGNRIHTLSNADTFFSLIKDEYEATIAEFKASYLQMRGERDGGYVPDYFTNVPVPNVIDPSDWSALHNGDTNNRGFNNNSKINRNEN